MECKGRFQLEPRHILDKKVTLLRNRAIGHVKVQWNHLGFNEATWELEDSMKEAYPFLFSFENIENGVILRGENVIPPFDP